MRVALVPILELALRGPGVGRILGFRSGLYGRGWVRAAHVGGLNAGSCCSRRATAQVLVNPPTITATLNAGEHEVGKIVFDLPARHGKIVYSPNYQGAPLAYWRF